MTNAEAIEILGQYHVNFEPYNAEDIVCAIDMAIEALEQKQSEDCISREWVLDKIRFYAETITSIEKSNGAKNCAEFVERAPSVVLKPKRGVWLDYLKNGLKWECSECGSKFNTPWYYCPHCGADMRGDKE